MVQYSWQCMLGMSLHSFLSACYMQYLWIAWFYFSHHALFSFSSLLTNHPFTFSSFSRKCVYKCMCFEGGPVLYGSNVFHWGYSSCLWAEEVHCSSARNTSMKNTCLNSQHDRVPHIKMATKMTNVKNLKSILMGASFYEMIAFITPKGKSLCLVIQLSGSSHILAVMNSFHPQKWQTSNPLSIKYVADLHCENGFVLLSPLHSSIILSFC